jgi:hypothetical protein
MVPISDRRTLACRLAALVRDVWCRFTPEAGPQMGWLSGITSADAVKEAANAEIVCPFLEVVPVEGAP